MFKSVLIYNVLLFIVSSFAEKIIIDTDAGVDDAMAILLFLRAESSKQFYSPQYEVVGVTCSYGNTIEENVEINVLRTLAIANRDDIAVYGGAKKPLMGNFSSDNFYGDDGFGDVEFNNGTIRGVNSSMHASMAMMDLTKKYEGNVSIVILGPTTNVALAISLDPEFVKRVKHFYVMGASVAGIGNLRPNVEFNFGADPISNFILLNSTTNSQLSLFPWETGLNTRILKSWRTDVLGNINSPLMIFLNQIEAKSLNKTNVYYTPCDAMTVASILWPQIVTSTLETHVEAVVDGGARGSLLVDYYKRSEEPVNARIIQSVDGKLFKEMLSYYLTCEKLQC